jgi:hypothetical protein
MAERTYRLGLPQAGRSAIPKQGLLRFPIYEKDRKVVYAKGIAELSGPPAKGYCLFRTVLLQETT